MALARPPALLFLLRAPLGPMLRMLTGLVGLKEAAPPGPTSAGLSMYLEAGNRKQGLKMAGLLGSQLLATPNATRRLRITGGKGLLGVRWSGFAAFLLSILMACESKEQKGNPTAECGGKCDGAK